MTNVLFAGRPRPPIMRGALLLKGGLTMEYYVSAQTFTFLLLIAGSDLLERSPEEWALYLMTKLN